MSDNEKRLWFDFKDPQRTALILTSAIHSVRDLLEAGKVEEAKMVVNTVIAELDKSKIANGDELTKMFFGNRKKE